MQKAVISAFVWISEHREDEKEGDEGDEEEEEEAEGKPGFWDAARRTPGFQWEPTELERLTTRIAKIVKLSWAT